MEPAARNDRPSPQQGDKRRAESPASTEPLLKRQQNVVPPASQPKEASVDALGSGSTAVASGAQGPRRDRDQTFDDALIARVLEEPEKNEEAKKERSNRARNFLPADRETREKLMREREAEYEAEEERRKGLTLAARLKEDGDTLLPQLRDAKAEITLQQTPVSYNGGARCRAGNDCLFKCAMDDSGTVFPEWYDPTKIKDEFRIHIERGSYDRHMYYHVACFEAMIDLAPLVPDLFSLDTQPYKGDLYSIPRWGVMFRKWFAHRGQINLGKIEEYIMAEHARDEQYCELIKRWEEIHKSRGCEKRFDLGALCDCPQRPKWPERPILRDHVAATGDKGCSLADIVHHRYCGMMEQNWRVWIERDTVHIETDCPENELEENETRDHEPEGDENTMTTRSS